MSDAKLDEESKNDIHFAMRPVACRDLQASHLAVPTVAFGVSTQPWLALVDPYAVCVMKSGYFEPWF